MNRLLLCGLASLCIAWLVPADKLDIEQREASVGYINNLQSLDGGFRPSANDTTPTISATTVSLRALKYFGGRPRDKAGPAKFLKNCYDSSVGGYSETAGGKPDVRTTAMGLMAAVELKLPLKDEKKAIVGFFAKNAEKLPEIYIAAAALHPAEIHPPTDVTKKWIAAFEATRNADGSYGKNAFENAGAVVTELRLGVPPQDIPAGAIHALKSAQQPDGGFPNAEGKSDLSTSYRVIRAFYMLHQKPDLARVTAFVASCRNSDGGYGGTPGQPSTASTTYFASIILHWVEELEKSSGN